MTFDAITPDIHHCKVLQGNLIIGTYKHDGIDLAQFTPIVSNSDTLSVITESPIIIDCLSIDGMVLVCA